MEALTHIQFEALKSTGRQNSQKEKGSALGRNPIFWLETADQESEMLANVMYANYSERRTFIAEPHRDDPT